MPPPALVFTARLMPPAVTGGLERFSADVLGFLPRHFEVADLANRGGKRSQWPYLLGLRRRVRRAVAQGRPRIVDGSDCSLAAAIAGHGVPSVLRAHGLDILQPSRPYQAYVRRYLPRVDLVVANSRPTRELLLARGIPDERIRVVHPAADAPAGWRPAPRPGRLLLAGRLVRRKGVAPFIRDVWPLVLARCPGAELDVVGDGPEMAAVRAAARAAPASDRIRLHGLAPRPVLEDLYRGADAFVMNNLRSPGDFEGFGIVAAEAQVRGVPVVARAVDGVVDAVLDGVTGTLVEGEEPAALAEAVGDVLDGRFRDRAALQRQAQERWGLARLERDYVAALRTLL
ncbi:MAG: phosphatidyl-myo-inositol dimannoside synthase [Thermoplasmata archaeon]|nr:phosphatidyl-myo-inositol dimannoside synthase [Thermoplasmata archaeon]